jgi:hypothetical protein
MFLEKKSATVTGSNFEIKKSEQKIKIARTRKAFDQGWAASKLFDT